MIPFRLSYASHAERAKALLFAPFYSHKPKSIRILDFTVAGVFRAGKEAQTVLHSLTLGETVFLRLDDRFGQDVSVQTASGMPFGWLPGSAVETLAPELERHGVLRAQVIGFVQPDSPMETRLDGHVCEPVLHIADTRCFAPIFTVYGT